MLTDELICCQHGRQEDAEEFLSVVLNGIHDEMVATINLHKNPEGAEKPGTGSAGGSSPTMGSPTPDRVLGGVSKTRMSS